MRRTCTGWRPVPRGNVHNVTPPTTGDRRRQETTTGPPRNPALTCASVADGRLDMRTGRHVMRRGTLRAPSPRSAGYASRAAASRPIHSPGPSRSATYAWTSRPRLWTTATRSARNACTTSAGASGRQPMRGQREVHRARTPASRRLPEELRPVDAIKRRTRGRQDMRAARPHSDGRATGRLGMRGQPPRYPQPKPGASTPRLIAVELGAGRPRGRGRQVMRTAREPVHQPPRQPNAPS